MATGMKKAILVTIIVGSGIAAYGYYGLRTVEFVPDVTTVSVTEGDIVDTVGATGALEAVTTVQVGSQVSGIIQELLVDFNSIVREGDVIMRLDPSLFETQLAQARANLARAEAEGVPAVVICASFEAALADLPEEDRDLFLEEMELSAPGLERMINAAYGLLNLLTFYTVNEKEARAWAVPEGATAYVAAGRIHTDFQRGFIRAEVVPVETFIARGGEQGAREAGEMRLEGRDYRVAAGDVIKFRFNV